MVVASVSFAVVAFAGSVGAIVVQAAKSGWQSVNLLGYLVWCCVYAAALLPVTAPLAYAGCRLARRQDS